MTNVQEIADRRTERKASGGWIGRAAVVAAVGLAGTAVGWYSGSHHREPAPSKESRPSAQARPSVLVHVARPAPGGIRRTSSQVGTVHPFQEADLFAKVSGYLSKLHVDYGDRVKAGQLLAEIDDPEEVEEANRAVADVALAKAAVGQAEAEVASIEADRAAFAAAVEQAEAEVERYTSMRAYHEKKFARYRDLVARKAVPQQIADEEEEGFESAQASEIASRKAVLNARAQLTAAEARVRKSQADVVQAKAAVEVAEARLAKARALVAYMKISSPYDGVVTRRNFFPGAFIRSAAEGGTVAVLTIARIDKVRVVTVVPDRDVPFADVGDEAEVTLDALPGRTFRGKVSRFADAEDPTSRTMHTEIDLINPDGILRPGMYGVATITLDQSAKALTLPASAVVGEAKGGAGDVFIVKDGVARKASVALGTDDGIRVEILSGIGPDDRAILGAGSISDGTPVQEESRPSQVATPPPAAPHHG